jgi:hypothetical protein
MLDLMASFLVNCAFTFDNYAEVPLLKEDRILHMMWKIRWRF